MYSMVLMMAMAPTPDATAFGGKLLAGHSCHGAVVASASCNGGCHGGNFLGLRGHLKSHGCHGSSCHGTVVSAPACAPEPACAPAPVCAPAPAPVCAPACAPAPSTSCHGCHGGGHGFLGLRSHGCHGGSGCHGGGHGFLGLRSHGCNGCHGGGCHGAVAAPACCN
jgi:hypothetical protein